MVLLNEWKGCCDLSAFPNPLPTLKPALGPYYDLRILP